MLFLEKCVVRTYVRDEIRPGNHDDAQGGFHDNFKKEKESEKNNTKSRKRSERGENVQSNCKRQIYATAALSIESIISYNDLNQL